MDSAFVYDPFSDLKLAQEINDFHLNLVGIRSGHDVLGIGCGPGDSTEKILERVGDHRYFGSVVAIDPDPRAIAAAENRFAGKKVRLYPCPVESLAGLKFAEQTFGVSIFANGIHYLKDPDLLRQALQAVHRITKERFAFWTAFAKEVSQGNKTNRFSQLWILGAYEMLEAKFGDLHSGRVRSENLQNRGVEEYRVFLETAGFRNIRHEITPFPFSPEVYEAIARFDDYVENALPMTHHSQVTTRDKSDALFAAVRPAYRRLGVETVERNYLFMMASR